MGSSALSYRSGCRRGTDLKLAITWTYIWAFQDPAHVLGCSSSDPMCWPLNDLPLFHLRSQSSFKMFFLHEKHEIISESRIWCRRAWHTWISPMPSVTWHSPSTARGVRALLSSWVSILWASQTLEPCQLVFTSFIVLWLLILSHQRLY